MSAAQDETLSREDILLVSSSLLLALMHFFVCQFVADTRTRDLIGLEAPSDFPVSFYTCSIIHFISMICFGFSLAAALSHDITGSHGGIFIPYILILLLDLVAWIFFWSRHAWRTALVVLSINICFIAATFAIVARESASCTLLIPLLLQEINLARNWTIFSKTNVGIKFSRTPGRLMKYTKKRTADIYMLRWKFNPSSDIAIVGLRPNKEESLSYDSTSE